EPFAALPAGRYTVKLTSIFNSGWQSIEVLRKAGVDLDERGRSSMQTDPTALPKTADFKPFDREFPQASRFLDVTRQVVIPAAAPTEVALSAVKSAHLTTPEHGRSELNLEQTTRLFALTGGFEPIGWSSAPGDGGRWIVTLDCRDGGTRKEAKWEYDPKTKRVRYLDPLAKTLSWGLRQYGAPGDLGYP